MGSTARFTWPSRWNSTPTSSAPLARRLVQDLTAAERLPYTLAIHEGEGRNPHAHVMWSERGNDGHDRSAETWFKRANSKEPARGGARKSSAANSKDWLPGLREQWADRVNEALAQDRERRVRFLEGTGLTPEQAAATVPEERVDHRSLAVQAAEAQARGDEDRAAELAREPNVHLGPVAVQSIERQAQGKPPMRKLEAAADVERRNGIWAGFQRHVHQLREDLAELQRELRRITRRLPYARQMVQEHRQRQREEPGRDRGRSFSDDPRWG